MTPTVLGDYNTYLHSSRTSQAQHAAYSNIALHRCGQQESRRDAYCESLPNACIELLQEMEALQFLVETDGVLVLSHLDNIHSPHRELVGL